MQDTVNLDHQAHVRTYSAYIVAVVLKTKKKIYPLSVFTNNLEFADIDKWHRFHGVKVCLGYLCTS